MAQDTRLTAAFNRIVTALNAKAAVGHTHLTSHISNATAFGRSLMAAADAPSARALAEAAWVDHQHAEDYAPTAHTHDAPDMLFVPQNYTPVLTATTTDPTIGNSVFTGKYVDLGTFCWVSIYFFAGSTWSAGSGFYRVTLPVPPTTSRHQLLNLHVSQGGERPGDCKIETGSGRIERGYVWDPTTQKFDTFGSASALAANNGRFYISGFYETT